MTVSLRTRLLAATVLAALVALGIVDVATYTLVTRAQIAQVDDELERSHPPIERAASVPFGALEQSIREVAPSSFVEVYDASGRAVVTVPLRRPGSDPISLTSVPVDPGAGIGDDRARFASIHTGPGDDDILRVRVSRQEDGGVLVIGQLLNQVEHTRHRLLVVLFIGTIGAIVAAVVLGSWFVRLGLAPLLAVERAAADVTGPDLDRRVPGATEATEVGRLATAINTMLDRLHDAFRQRERDVEALQASEARMRRFVADASHELRTPLSATAAYAELFERGARDRPEDLARAMTGIRVETARMAELVDDLLLLAQLDEHRPLDRVPVDLSEVAAAAVQAAHVLAPDRHVGLQIADVVVIEGDESRIRQVLDNLLANVRSHTPPGTACLVDVRREGNEAVVSVIDDGPGLPDDQLASLTDRFFRADDSRARSTGGAGLGLAIVRAIVEAHAGTLHIDSPAEGGLRVAVRLPIRSDRPNDTQESP